MGVHERLCRTLELNPVINIKLFADGRANVEHGVKPVALHPAQEEVFGRFHVIVIADLIALHRR